MKNKKLPKKGRKAIELFLSILLFKIFLKLYYFLFCFQKAGFHWQRTRSRIYSRVVKLLIT